MNIKKFGAVMLTILTLAWSIPVLAQCRSDRECKGNRICSDGRCVNPVHHRHHRRSYRDRDRYSEPQRHLKVGFGASVLTGPMWVLYAGSGVFWGTGTIADVFLMNVDVNLGVCLDWANKFTGRGLRMMLGMGFRPLITSAGATYDVYLFKLRTQRSIITGSVGLGLHTGGGITLFALQAGFGLGFNVGNHAAIDLDLIDLSSYYGHGGVIMLLNTLMGVSIHF